MQLKEGALLQNGKYRIIRVLGQGGFGITYLAEHTILDKIVAIKEFFPKDFCGRDNTSHLTIGTQNNAETVTKLKERFLKEAKNIATLDNPGIVKIHDIFEENNTAYYVMDYIEGENLNEIVKRNGPLSETKALAYIQKVGEALEYIHSHQMTHFDVKPANIVVRRNGDCPVLIDFGLSKQYDTHGDATSTLMQGVSSGYSPIELYSPNCVTTFSPQTDVYSLGATLYYLITGETPPSALQILEDGIKFPKGISAGIFNAINGAMSANRSMRCKSVSTFCSSLRYDNHVSEDTRLLDNRKESNVFTHTAESHNIGVRTESSRTIGVSPHDESSNRKSGAGIYAVFGLIVVAIVLFFCFYDGGNGNESQKSNDVFTDKSQIRKGDYVYEDGAYFSHTKLSTPEPTARVISNDYYKKCITLSPVTNCKSEEIDGYVTSFAQLHNNVRVPSIDDWRYIHTEIYNMIEVSEVINCSPGIGAPTELFSHNHSYTNYTYKNTGEWYTNEDGTKWRPIAICKDFKRGLNAWCDEVYHLNCGNFRACFSIGCFGNYCEKYFHGNENNALYLIYDL